MKTEVTKAEGIWFRGKRGVGRRILGMLGKWKMQTLSWGALHPTLVPFEAELSPFHKAPQDRTGTHCGRKTHNPPLVWCSPFYVFLLSPNYLLPVAVSTFGLNTKTKMCRYKTKFLLGRKVFLKYLMWRLWQILASSLAKLTSWGTPGICILIKLILFYRICSLLECHIT